MLHTGVIGEPFLLAVVVWHGNWELFVFLLNPSDNPAFRLRYIRFSLKIAYTFK